MGQAHRNPYLFESRWDPTTAKRTPCVGVQCKKCGKEEWHPAPNAGWGRRIFRNRHWKLGNGPGTHVCPTCEEFRRSGVHRKPIPAYEGQVVHLLSRREETDDNHQTVPPESPQAPPPEPVNTVMAEALAPVKAEIEKKAVRILKRGKPTGYAFEPNAAYAARKRLREMGVREPYERGVHYSTFKEEGGTYGWALIGDALNGARLQAAQAPAARERSPSQTVYYNRLRLKEGQITRTRGTAVMAAIKWLKASGVEGPKEGEDFHILQPGDRQWCFKFGPGESVHPFRNERHLEQLAEARRIREAKRRPSLYEQYQDHMREQPPVSDASTQAVRDMEDSQPAAPDRQASLDDKRRIRAAIEDHFDEANQRWRGDYSDRKLADELDVPRVWVSPIRELYGRDENESAEIEAKKKAQKIDLALIKAANAKEVADRIFNDVAELETLMTELRSLREGITA